MLVNPVVLESAGEQKEEEGCLSVPDLAREGDPARRASASGRADASGAVREIEGTGLLARALCHETDHLNGMLFVDRLRGLKRELTWRKIQRQKGEGGLVSLTAFNTLGRKMTDLSPLEPGHVRLYTCGPTVYNVVHIGNLRTFLWEDVLRRHLQSRRAGGSRRS